LKTALLILVYCTKRHNISKLYLIKVLFNQILVIQVFPHIEKNNMAEKKGIDMASEIPV
jgi:hypothetical protein